MVAVISPRLLDVGVLFSTGFWMVVVISWKLVNGCCFFLQASEWFSLFPEGFWMIVVISWTLLDGCSYFTEASEWLSLFDRRF